MADLKKEDMGEITLEPLENNMYLWRGTIPGPEGSVYEGGVFHVEIHLPPDYPCVSSSLPEALVTDRKV
jgi:ubiquitin-conjugating enzyme E2 D/E